jgi:hypothetical protein
MVLIIPLTEMKNIQVPALQPLYFALDKSWLLFRSLFFLIISIFGFLCLFRTHRSTQTIGTIRYLSFMFIGLIVSLAVFYGYSCCDSPVVFYMGFPFSWLRGITPAQHYLSLPAFEYLTANVLHIDWEIKLVSLVLDILFLYNIIFLMTVLKQQGLMFALKRKNSQNT